MGFARYFSGDVLGHVIRIFVAYGQNFLIRHPATCTCGLLVQPIVGYQPLTAVQAS